MIPRRKGEKKMKLGTVKATVFDAKKEAKRKNTVIANISTYEGKDQNGNNRYCAWKARFVGDAYEPALNLVDKDRIVITIGKIENNYNKEQEKLYVVVTVFEFEMDDDKTGTNEYNIVKTTRDTSVECDDEKQNMKIKEMYDTPRYPYHYMVEFMDGSTKLF